MKGSLEEFFFDCVHLLYYKCHKINPNRGGSYTDSSVWIKRKTINSINKKNIISDFNTIALNHAKIEVILQE